MRVITAGILRDSAHSLPAHPRSHAYKYTRWITNIAVSFPLQSQNSGITKTLKEGRQWEHGNSFA